MTNNLTRQVVEFNDGYLTTVNTEDGPVEQWHEEHFFAPFAQDEAGHRWQAEAFNDKADAETLFAQLGEPDVDPRWNVQPPVYGSDAWDNGAEFELAAFEADAYGEPLRW
jgi:hypothetical protein